MTVRGVAEETHPALFLTVTLYGPGTSALNTPVVLVYVTPSMLKVMPAAGAGDVTVIVPVAIWHVGCCVTLAVGAGGVNG